MFQQPALPPIPPSLMRQFNMDCIMGRINPSHPGFHPFPTNVHFPFPFLGPNAPIQQMFNGSPLSRNGLFPNGMMASHADQLLAMQNMLPQPQARPVDLLKRVQAHALSHSVPEAQLSKTSPAGSIQGASPVGNGGDKKKSELGNGQVRNGGTVSERKRNRPGGFNVAALLK